MLCSRVVPLAQTSGQTLIPARPLGNVAMKFIRKNICFLTYFFSSVSTGREWRRAVVQCVGCIWRTHAHQTGSIRGYIQCNDSAHRNATRPII